MQGCKVHITEGRAAADEQCYAHLQQVRFQCDFAKLRDPMHVIGSQRRREVAHVDPGQNRNDCEVWMQPEQRAHISAGQLLVVCCFACSALCLHVVRELGQWQDTRRPQQGGHKHDDKHGKLGEVPLARTERLHLCSASATKLGGVLATRPQLKLPC